MKYALITGAGTGIGYEMALALHRRGYLIIGVTPEFDRENMEPLVEQIGLFPVTCDITKIDEIKAAVELVRLHTGNRLDILYNNAGISAMGGPVVLADDDLMRQLFHVNVLGHIYMTKYFSPMVINTQGTIVFTASVAGRVPLSWVAGYCATKAAIDQYAFVLRGEMRPFGVTVHSVITGGVQTGICDKASLSPLTEIYDQPEVMESLEACAYMSRNPWTSVTAKVYAERVAAKICSRGIFGWLVGFNIYEGSMLYLLHLLRWYCPVWLVEWGVQNHFKQRKAFAKIRQAHLKAQAESRGSKKRD